MNYRRVFKRYLKYLQFSNVEFCRNLKEYFNIDDEIDRDRYVGITDEASNIIEN